MAPKQQQGRAANALAGTLHDAETRQLEDFIKKRSKVLDSDINEMRRKLGASGKMLGESIPYVQGSAILETIKVDGVSVLSHSHMQEKSAPFSGQDAMPVSRASGAEGHPLHLTPFGTTTLDAARAHGMDSPPRVSAMKKRLGTFLARIKIREFTEQNARLLDSAIPTSANI